MEPEDRSVLAENIDLLMETRNIESVIDELLQRNVLSAYGADQLNMIPNGEDKIRALYDEIQSRGPSAFEHLLSALVVTDNENITTALNQKRYGANSQYLKIKVINAKTRLDIDDGSSAHVYHMGSRPKGHALIVNINRYFVPGRRDELREMTRLGSFRDVANLYTLLQQLGYNVRIVYDLTREQIKSQVRDFARMADHEFVDSTMVVVMSHGGDVANSFKSYDWQDVLCDRDIVSQFHSNICQHLQGKPKIFVFQMCRGDERDFGVASSPTSGVTSQSTSGITSSSTSAVTSSTRSQTVDSISDGTSFGATESDSARPFQSSIDNQTAQHQQTYESSINNNFQIHSTSMDHTSFRDTVTGSHLVHHMCAVFAQHAHECELLELVRRTTSCITSYYDRFNGIMTPHFEGSGDFRKFYFNPGLYDQSAVSNNNNNVDNDNLVINNDFTFLNRGNRSSNINNNHSSNIDINRNQSTSISSRSSSSSSSSSSSISSSSNNCIENTCTERIVDKDINSQNNSEVGNNTESAVVCNGNNEILSVNSQIISKNYANIGVSSQNNNNVGSNGNMVANLNSTNKSALNCVQESVDSLLDSENNFKVGCSVTAVGSNENSDANFNFRDVNVGKSVCVLTNGEYKENRGANLALSNNKCIEDVINNSKNVSTSNNRFKDPINVEEHIENCRSDINSSRFEKPLLNISKVPVESSLSAKLEDNCLDHNGRLKQKNERIYVTNFSTKNEDNGIDIVDKGIVAIDDEEKLVDSNVSCETCESSEEKLCDNYKGERSESSSENCRKKDTGFSKYFKKDKRSQEDSVKMEGECFGSNLCSFC